MSYILLVIMTMLGTVAAIFFKKVSGENLKTMVLNINLYIGVLLYLLAAILNIYILRFFDYSFVLPMTSLTYMWTVFASRFVFKEKIVKKKIIGILFIMIGAILIAIN